MIIIKNQEDSEYEIEHYSDEYIRENGLIIVN